MKCMKCSKVYILDTSAILSGKPLNLGDGEVFTTRSVAREIKPGGRDYRNFQFLKERGLVIAKPSEKAIEKIKGIITKSGDIDRLSTTDIDVLSLAYELKKQGTEPVILTDDYSIQNVAEYIKVRYESISQSKIKKKFKWVCRCQGCGRIFKNNIRICPICGTKTKKVVSSEKNLINVR